MAVTINVGQRQGQDSWGGVQVLTVSTATAEQSINITQPVTTLSGGTATGFTRNRYVLGAGNEGDQKTIFHLATGESFVRFGAATTDLLATGGIHMINVATATGAAITAMGAITASATGCWVLSTQNSFLKCIFQNGAWWLVNGSATLATAT